MKYPLILLIEKIRSFTYPLNILYPLIYIKRKFIDSGAHGDTDINGKLFLERRVRNGINNIDMLWNSTGFKFENKLILELGTGYHGIDLILFYLLGTNKVYTVDAKFSISGLIFNTLPVIEPYLKKMATMFNVSERDIFSRWEKIKYKREDVSGLLQCMSVEFISIGQFLSESQLSNKIDMFYSESTLQRIPLANLDKLFATVGKQLNVNAVAFHRIDARDINVQRTKSMFDPNLWRFEYLKFNDLVWKLITTTRYGSQNRLRVSEFIAIFQQIGCTSVCAEHYTYCDDVERLKNFNLGRRFKSIALEDIAVAHSRIVFSRQKTEGQSIVRTHVIEGDGVCYPMEKWNPEKGLLEGDGLND